MLVVSALSSLPLVLFFFFKQKTAYEMRISDWSSDVCSSDLTRRKGGTAMSQPFSRFLHPFEVARHPSLEPEVKRAILASWASDRSAVRNQPGLRQPPGARRPIPVDEILAAMHTLDQGHERQIGRESCREMVLPYDEISDVCL